MHHDFVRVHVAEFIGTFAIVFLGAGAVCVAGIDPEPWQLIAVTIAAASSYAAAIALSVGAPSGYFNPAITLMLWVFRRIESTWLFTLVIVQLLAAALAGLLLRMIYGGSELLMRRTHLGTPHLGSEFLGSTGLIAQLKGMLLELLLTMFLVFVLQATILDPKRRLDGRVSRWAGIWYGLGIAACTVAGFRLTGAAMNPARYFGPMIFEWTVLPDAWRDHTVYWMGPIAGALFGGWLYTTVFSSSEKRAHES